MCISRELIVNNSGVNINHVDLGGRAQWGVNTVQGSRDADINGHGTMVAGVVAGTEFGVAKRARIIAVKVLVLSREREYSADPLDMIIRH